MLKVFKPTWGKILLTLMLPFFVYVSVEVQTAGGAYLREFVPGFSVFPYVMMILGIIAYSANGENSVTEQWPKLSAGDKILGVLLELVLPLIISYLISCLILAGAHALINRIKKTKPQDAPPESSTEE